MDVVDGRRAPFPPHHYGNSGDTRDTDTQAPSSGDSSPLPRPCSSDHLHSPDGSPCSAEEIDKGVPSFDRRGVQNSTNCYTLKSVYRRLCAKTCIKLFVASEGNLINCLKCLVS